MRCSPAAQGSITPGRALEIASCASEAQRLLWTLKFKELLCVEQRHSLKVCREIRAGTGCSAHQPASSTGSRSAITNDGNSSPPVPGPDREPGADAEPLTSTGSFSPPQSPPTESLCIPVSQVRIMRLKEVKDYPRSPSWKAVGWIQGWIWTARSLHRPTQLPPGRMTASHKPGEGAQSPVCLLAKESFWGKHSSPTDLHASFSSLLLVFAQLFAFSRGLPCMLH